MGTCHSKCCGSGWELALTCPHAFTTVFKAGLDRYMHSIGDHGETTIAEAMKLVQDAILLQEYNVDDVD